MSKIKAIVQDYTETVYMRGNKTADGSYFVCEFRKDLDDGRMHCKKFDKPLESKADCNMDCEEYGYCENCRGFSAIGCEVCVIPRAGRKSDLK